MGSLARYGMGGVPGITDSTGETMSEGATLRPTSSIAARSVPLLLLLLCVDFVLIVLHIIGQTFGQYFALLQAVGLYNNLLVYQLAKLTWVIILLAYVVRSTRCRGYIAWMLVFAYLLLDKAFEIHQGIGDRIASSTALPQALGLAPRYYELAVLLITGVLLFAVVGVAYARSPYPFRRASRDLFLLVVAWVAFGLVTDLAAALGLGPVIEFASDFVEDGGEMVVVSLILWYVYRLAMSRGISLTSSSPSS
jgi:hypothetical protein